MPRVCARARAREKWWAFATQAPAAYGAAWSGEITAIGSLAATGVLLGLLGNEGEFVLERVP